MHTQEWVFYLAGAVLTLAWKWQRYCYESKGKGIPFWKASGQWWEFTTAGSQVSWIATVGVVWLIGSFYIDKVGLDWLTGDTRKLFEGIPLNASTAFLVGGMAELLSPMLAKKLLSKFNAAP